MTALRDQFQKARAVLQSLVYGLRPVTGIELSKDDIVKSIEVNRAMSTAVMALDQITARVIRRERLPEKVGKGWTDEEEQQLKTNSAVASRCRSSLRNIAAPSGRSRGG